MVCTVGVRVRFTKIIRVRGRVRVGRGSNGGQGRAWVIIKLQNCGRAHDDRWTRIGICLLR